MKDEHHCHCHEHSHEDEHHCEHGECHCGHHHEEAEEHCCCGHHHEEEAEQDYAQLNAMFGLEDGAPDDALALLQTEMNECDDLSELLGLGRYPDVDDILDEAIMDLTPKKKKTLMNLAVILHDYLPDED